MPNLVIVTGLSGSGKSTALRALEDVGFFCMDNLPFVLLPKVLDLANGASAGAFQNIAVGIDARERHYLPQALQSIREVEEQGIRPTLIFLDAREDALIKRFSETRRRHPLAHDGDVRDAIERERGLIEPLRERADLVVDTSQLTVHELKDLVQSRVTGTDVRKLVVRIVSFGFKHGIPHEADLLFDVRFLPNPHFIPHLRDGTGLDPEVAAFVERQENTTEFLDRVQDLLLFLLPRYLAEGKVYLTIGIGCTGGRHRSVTIAENLARRLAGHAWAARVEHREQERWSRT